MKTCTSNSVRWIVILAIGLLFRLVFPGDIEFKADEAFTFERVIAFGSGTPWPWTGMNSSANIPNPGMTLWVFLGLGKLFAVRSPIDLARAVALMNCLSLVALFLFAAFAFRDEKSEERSIWLWAAALAAVNPVLIILQRKIWPQSMLPPFVLAMFIFWHFRNRPWGAFCWGLVGALLGQIHMAGFFAAAGLVLWTMLAEKARARTSWRFHWRTAVFWIGGSVLGALPLIPWVLATVRSLHSNENAFKAIRLLLFKFWNYWLAGAFGINLSYSLGDEFWEFLRYPLSGGNPAFVAAIAEVSAIACLVAVMVLLIRYWQGRKWPIREIAFGDASETALAVGAMLWGMGLLITVSGAAVHTHYLLATFPIQFVWLAQACHRFGKYGRRLLQVTWVSQFLLSAIFLRYIHVNGGAPKGDFGVSYSRQVGH